MTTQNDHTSRRRGLAGALALAALLAATTAQAQSEAPLHTYLGGERVTRALDPTRIAVHFESPLADAEARAVAERAGLSVWDVTRTAGNYFTVLDLTVPSTSAEDAKARLDRLLLQPEVAVVAPVLIGEVGRIIPNARVLVKVAPDYRGEAGAIFAELAPGFPVDASNFAGIQDVYRLEDPSGNAFTTMAVANRLAEDPRIAWAEASALATGRHNMTPTDDLYLEQWGLGNWDFQSGLQYLDMTMDLAWDITTGSSQIPVLVLDIGVQLNHPDLNIGGGRDFVDANGAGQPNDGSPEDSLQVHGTLVAGCISAKMNGAGVVGVAPDCPVLSARIGWSDPQFPGDCLSFSYWIDSVAVALDWGRVQGARVTNNSNRLEAHNTINDAYTITRNAGLIHFAAAGNDGVEAVDYPASLGTVNAVTAIDQYGDLADFSNWGTNFSTVQFTAPGVGIWTTDRTGTDGVCATASCFGDCIDSGGGTHTDYAKVDGTSFASPYAAGVAALVLSQDASLTPDQVTWIMRCTARDLGTAGHDHFFGHGMPIANSALRYPTRRVSLTSTAGQADGLSANPDISGDGRFMVFESESNALDQGLGASNTRDIFVHDRHTGLTAAVSWVPSGPDGDSFNPSASHDGRWVAFDTYSRDTNGLLDVYVMDRDYDENDIFDEYGQCDAFGCDYKNYRVSVDTAGGSPDGNSFAPSISSDGRYTAFVSGATDLVVGDTNGQDDIFVRDISDDVTVRVSINTTNGAQADGRCDAPFISADGRYVAFATYATTLVASDTNGFADVYVHDRDVSGDGTFDEAGDVSTFRASLTSTGGEPNWESGIPSVTVSEETGNLLVSFTSGAWNMHPDDTNDAFDVFLRDVDAGTTSIVSVTSSGISGDLGGFTNELSTDGRYVVFNATSTNLVTGDINGKDDIFLRDLVNDRTVIVSLSSANAQANDHGLWPAVTADGNHVVWASGATNLDGVLADTNGFHDIFLYQCAPREAPEIIEHPSDIVVEPGDTIVFSVVATGSPPPDYQWRKDGVNIPGAIFPGLVIENATEDDMGVYDVIVSNFEGSVVSNPASATTGVVDVSPVASTVLGLRLAPRPNPMAVSTSVRFALPQAERVRLRILDVAGRLVRELVDERREAGVHVVSWDGRTERGLEAANGMYYMVLSAGEWRSHGRVTVVR